MSAEIANDFRANLMSTLKLRNTQFGLYAAGQGLYRIQVQIPDTVKRQQTYNKIKAYLQDDDSIELVHEYFPEIYFRRF